MRGGEEEDEEDEESGGMAAKKLEPHTEMWGTKVSYNVTYKSVPQECPKRLFRKSVLQECSQE